MLLEPVLATTQFSFYREARNFSVGRCIGYLGFLSALFAAAATLAAYVNVSAPMNDAIEWAAQNAPPVTIEGGKASSDVKGPVVIRHPQFKDIAFVIDTNRTSPVTFQEMQDQKAVAFLTQDHLYMALQDDRLQVYPLTNQRKAVLNADSIRATGRLLARVLYPAVCFGVLLSYFLWKLLASLFYAVIGVIINAVTSSNLDFESIFKLGVYAQTPGVLLQIAVLFVPAKIVGLWLVSILIVSVYLWQAMRQQHPAEPDEHSSPA